MKESEWHTLTRCDNTALTLCRLPPPVASLHPSASVTNAQTGLVVLEGLPGILVSPDAVDVDVSLEARLVQRAFLVTCTGGVALAKEAPRLPALAVGVLAAV